MRFAAILFDFDGVLIESELASSRQIADWLTGIGISTTPEEARCDFMGLAGADFMTALERRIGRPAPAEFHTARIAAARIAMAEGIAEVAGAVAFVRALPPELPIAVVSSSSTDWIKAHLGHLGLADRFGDRIASGGEHVARGKPAPDIYLYAARLLGVNIARCLVIEDSPVGVTGAVESGAQVVGLCAGSHCGADHGASLRARGAHVIAASFAEVAALLADADQPGGVSGDDQRVAGAEQRQQA